MSSDAPFRHIIRMHGFQYAVFTIGVLALCFVVAYLVARQQIDISSSASCRAMRALDQVKDGLQFQPPATAYEEYTARVIPRIHEVYIALGCGK